MSDKNSKASSDRNNNETVEEKVVKEERKIKPEILETLLPTTISYNSTCLPDAIFLTTSNGQLITTSTINYNTFLAGLNLPTTSTKHEESKAAALKPSASDNKSSAQNSTNSTSSSTTNIISSTSTQQLFKFPFLTSLQGGLAPFAPISTFGLPNALIAPNLTFPIYNSLLTVTTAAKEQTPDAKKATDSSTKASKSSSKKGSMTTSRGRKRTAQSRLPAKLKEPAAVARRNARERRRVKMVNDGFLRLRRHVPTDPKNKKLSKVKTLRLAIEYIHHLQDLLQSDAPNLQISIPQMTTTFDDDDDGDTTWLNTDSVNRLEMDEEIFQTIDPARLRTNYNEFIDR